MDEAKGRAVLRDLIEPSDPKKKKLIGMTYARYGLHLYVVNEKKDVAPYLLQSLSSAQWERGQSSPVLYLSYIWSVLR